MSNLNNLDEKFKKIKNLQKEINLLVAEIVEFAKNNDAMAYAKASVILKELGYLEKASSLLEEGVVKFPKFHLLKYELILVLILLKKNSEAIWLITDSLKNFPGEEIFINQAILSLVFSNVESEEINYKFYAAIFSSAQKNSSEFLKEYISYGMENTGRFFSLENRLELATSLSAKQLHRTIESAIVENKPFCFLRLGDGEGAILQGLVQDNPEGFKKINRKKFLNRWFGSASIEVEDKVESISIELKSRLDEADVLGCPQWGWISSLRKKNQLQPLFNAIEATIPALNSGRALTDVGICLFMEQERLLVDLVRKAGSFSMITSRPELPVKLAEVTGAKIKSIYLIPPPASDPDVREGEMVRGAHLFDCFDKLRANLAACDGKGLFLISAGFLGKIYALDIKKQGGVAIDIGHVADRWIGYDSRPESKGPDLRLCNIKFQ